MKQRVLLAAASSLLAFALTLGAASARADTIEELRAKIDERNQTITELEKEIAGYQDELEKVGKETKTLQGTIATINLEQKKLAADIKVTENRIAAATLVVLELSGDIKANQEKIERGAAAIGRALRFINRAESQTLIEVILNRDSLSGFFEDVDELRKFETNLREEKKRVEELKATLETERLETEKRRRELAALKTELSDRKQILELNKRNKNALLASTKNKESEYKKLLADRVKLRDAFADELLEFESELKFAIDPTRLPETGSGVLKWPLDSVKITQYFGNTPFARSGAYNGHGHNGIDLRASIGTPVRAALSGVVRGAGDTDTVCRGASYGKWALIEHQNGLSTLYAHLSLNKVEEGQTVNAGEIIGYSGDTGYATGPHLHFTVYATQGVRVMARKSSVCRGTYTMPIADLKAYLNPLSYL